MSISKKFHRSIIFLLMLFSFLLIPKNVNAATGYFSVGNAVTYYVVVDGTYNQTCTVTLGTTSRAANRASFLASPQYLYIYSISNSVSNWSLPYLSFPGQGTGFNSVNSVPDGANPGSYCYAYYSATLQNGTGFSHTAKYINSISGTSPYPVTGGWDNIGKFLNYWSGSAIELQLCPAGIVTLGGARPDGGCYLTLYYTRNSYTLTYNANGGSVSPGSKSVAYKGTYGALPTPTWSNHKFLGWYTSPSGGSAVSASTTMGAGNATIYAHWEAGKTLTFNANGGTVSPTSRSPKYNGDTYGTLPTPTRTDHDFLGWFTAASGGSQVTANTTMGTSNVTIYAHWSRHQYTIKFNGNGAAGSMADQKCNTNATSTLNAMSGFTRNGFYFRGWATQLYTNDPVYANKGTVNSLAGMNGTVTLYAVWRRSGTGFKQLPMYHTDMFKNNYVIAGQAGTTFASPRVNGIMAHVDQDPAHPSLGPGYFSIK